jgi:hypothetical protein
MKTPCLLALALLSTVVCQAQPVSMPPLHFAPPGLSVSANTNVPANYVIKVMMKDAKGNEDSLQVTTVDGSFELDTIQKSPTKINGNDIPSTLKLSGSLTPLDEKKAVVKFYLGHTVPYVTSSNPGPYGGGSSYSQLSVGLESSFVVTYGKSLVVQSDDSGEVSVLVTREKD